MNAKDGRGRACRAVRLWKGRRGGGTRYRLSPGTCGSYMVFAVRHLHWVCILATGFALFSSCFFACVAFLFSSCSLCCLLLVLCFSRLDLLMVTAALPLSGKAA